MRITWDEFVRKVSSRKLWAMIAGFIGGLILAFGGGENLVATVGGLIMAGGGIVAYIFGEAWVDAARLQASQNDFWAVRRNGK